MNKEHQTIYDEESAPKTRIHPEVDYKVGDKIVRAYSYEEAVAKAEFVRDSICAAADFSEAFPSILESAEQERRELRKIEGSGQ
jgi:hypothetical protein